MNFLLSQFHHVLLGVVVRFVNEDLQVPSLLLLTGFFIDLSLQSVLVHKLKLLILCVETGLQLEVVNFGVLENIDELFCIFSSLDVVLDAHVIPLGAVVWFHLQNNIISKNGVNKPALDIESSFRQK